MQNCEKILCVEQMMKINLLNIILSPMNMDTHYTYRQRYIHTYRQVHTLTNTGKHARTHATHTHK